ncbi:MULTISPECIES: DUF1508 domain-containing protein [unclassified Acidovorax]|uniref:DUF1508 domain-containing protein n=1 Tax=unclassified Acidovorax TaxID=2684926 RepID=UPI00071011F5|nr:MULTISPECIES: DUF1508 domain-containing protein [unclassified Acidovorax]KRD26454.1 hypothetical protein ASE39_19655 [Acidovorax sp. Root267]
MKFIYYREESSNLWRWTLYGEDRRKVAESVEKYYNATDCLAAIELVRNSKNAEITQRQTP